MAGARPCHVARHPRAAFLFAPSSALRLGTPVSVQHGLPMPIRDILGHKTQHNGSTPTLHYYHTQHCNKRKALSISRSTFFYVLNSIHQYRPDNSPSSKPEYSMQNWTVSVLSRTGKTKSNAKGLQPLKYFQEAQNTKKRGEIPPTPYLLSLH